MSQCMTKPTRWPVHPAKTQFSLGIWSDAQADIRPGWSESSLGAQDILLVLSVQAKILKFGISLMKKKDNKKCLSDTPPPPPPRSNGQ